MESQKKVTPLIKAVSSEIEGEGTSFLSNVICYLNQTLSIRKYNEQTRDHEKSIRWKRTADQILRDSYIYEGKSCTDLVICFQAICEAKGFPTKLVKLKQDGGKMVHSMAEVNINNQWYIVDVAGKMGIRKGQLHPDETYGTWKLWRRGEDSWDIGLSRFKDIAKID